MTAILSSVTTEGGLLHPELLERVVRQDPKLAGLTPADYHSQVPLGEAASRAWTALQPLWRAFRFKLSRLGPDDAATALTRDAWLLPLFRELGWGPLAPAGDAFRVGDTPVLVSHGWGHVPVHLVGARVSIDKRPTAAAAQGTPRTSPHGLVQDLLNRSDPSLWGVVSNGLLLRLLRDHQSLGSAAYVEIDLERVFDGGLYGEFALLFALCHHSRFEAPKAEDCWLERWFKTGQEEGVRALDRLRSGVETALTELGAGFLRHPENLPLREALKEGWLTKEDYFRELLRLVYRLLFLFVAEDRDALLRRDLEPEVRDRYTRFYSTERLRAVASRSRGGAHADSWQQLRLVLHGLWEGEPALGLPALGSRLFDPAELPYVGRSTLSNRHLFAALRALGELTEGKRTLRISYRNLGAQELGSVYEGLLELHPVLDVDAGTFELSSAAGHERKTTGSYYTPASLVDCLLDSALDPVLDAATVGRPQAEAEAALLALRVVDPACGSGHFLVAAARRLADRLARLRHPDEEPSPEDRRTAMRDVVGRCLFGVDLNPMAVELCKVSLWIEALEPGRPLSFLDAHIQRGNALLGATPALLARGIPDEAFEPLEGDDRRVASAIKRQNKTERSAIALDFSAPPPSTYVRLGEGARLVDAASDTSLAAVREKESRFAALVGSAAFDSARLLADLWCAAFVWRKDATARGEASPLRELCPTEATFRRLVQEPGGASAELRAEVTRLRDQYGFFHWHLAFPQILRPKQLVDEADACGWEGGFDVVLGNPPWEKVKLVEKEFFAERSPEIAQAPTAAARERLIRQIREADAGSPYFALARAYEAAAREAEGTSHLLRRSGRFPLCGKGDVNTYAVFAELDRALMGPTGRAGFIVPSGIATDDTTKEYFQAIVDGKGLVSLFDFQSGGELFGDIGHARFKFCLLTLGASSRAMFAFGLRAVAHLREPDRVFELTAEDIALINPNTRTCPVFRTRRDAEITKGIYRRVPVLVREARDGQPEVNPWGVKLSTMFHMSNDSHLFRTREQLEADGWHLEGNVFVKDSERMLPLYEGRLGHQFNHRFAQEPNGVTVPVTESQLIDPSFRVEPNNWVPTKDALEMLNRRSSGCRTGLLGFRRVARAGDERTVVACVLPWGPASYGFIVSTGPIARDLLILQSLYNSFAYDFVARSSLSQPSVPQSTFEQLAALSPVAFDTREPFGRTARDFVQRDALELTYTAWDLQPFAQDCGYDGPPFRWDPERRALLRAELDAAFFHLYGLPRDDVDYVMETFPIVKRHDEAAHGHYRTKRLILERYDAMAAAAATGQPYETVLDPPPADPRVAHPPRTP